MLLPAWSYWQTYGVDYECNHRESVIFAARKWQYILTIHQKYMQRCLELAIKNGFLAPNPMVGAVLVFENKLVGEGWHQKYSEAHAEVNCINDAMMRLNAESGRKNDIIKKSTLYVSLEPCAHFGKTPPCAELIIKHKISKVVIGSERPFSRSKREGN